MLVPFDKARGETGDELIPHHPPPQMSNSLRRAGTALLLTSICALASIQTIGWSHTARRLLQAMDSNCHQGPPTTYATVPGIFIQDDPDFDEDGYDSLKDSFGLIDKSEDRWTKLTRWLDKKNADADRWTGYKLLWIARHGEGYHNQAEEIYGTEAWDCYWSLMYTDGNITWGPDAMLNDNGIDQARKVNSAWKEQLAFDIPLPESLFSSPMRRAGMTLQETWHDILLDKGVRPRIMEPLRETVGLHTCDQRSDRSTLEETFPGWTFDQTFTQHDQLWNPTYRESQEHTALRLLLALNEIFATDPATVISITAHGGAISALFRVIGHRPFQVQTAGVVPVMVKASWKPTSSMPVIVGGQSLTAPACTAVPA